MAGIPDKIADAIIKNTIDLDRYGEGVKQKVLGILNKAQAEIIGKIAQIDPTAPTMTKWQEERLKTLNATISDIIDNAYKDIKGVSEDSLKKMVKPTAQATINGLNGSIGVNIFDVTLTPEMLNSLATKCMIEGNVIGTWWDKQSEDTKTKLIGQMNQAMEQIQIGTVQGESINALINRVRGTATTSGAMTITKNEADALVRTSVMQVANDVRKEVYKQNSDILNGYEWISTLDTRTTPICRAMDRKQYDLDFNPIGGAPPFPGWPPIHFRCRSTVIPVTKTYAELMGKSSVLTDKEKEALERVTPVGLRASMGGVVEGRMDYNEWLLKQPKEVQEDVLGITRRQLWLNNKLTMADLVHQNGRQLTLAELEARIKGGIVEVREQTLLEHIKNQAAQLLTVDDFKQFLDTMPEGQIGYRVIQQAGYTPESLFSEIQGGLKAMVEAPKIVWEPVKAKGDISSCLAHLGIKKVVCDNIKLVNVLGEEFTRMFNEFDNLSNLIHLKPSINRLAFYNSSSSAGLSKGVVGQYSRSMRTIKVVHGNQPWSTVGISTGGFSTSGSVMNITKHEFAHYLYRECLNKDAVDEWIKIYNAKGINWISKNVTKYASTNSSEFFSECFGIFSHPNYKPGTLGKEIEDFFIKWLKTPSETMTSKAKMSFKDKIVQNLRFGAQKTFALEAEQPEVYVWKVGDVVTDSKFTPITEPIDFKNIKDVKNIGEPEGVPTVPAGKHLASGVIMVEDNGSVWIYAPKGQYGGYKQTFAKGTVEGGLTLQQTAIKETFEETGLKAEIFGYLGDYEKSTSINRFYIGKRVAGSPVMMGEEAEAVLLVPQEQLKSFLNVNLDKAIADDLIARLAEYSKLGNGNIEYGAKLWANDALAASKLEEVLSSVVTPTLSKNFNKILASMEDASNSAKLSAIETYKNEFVGNQLAAWKAANGTYAETIANILAKQGDIDDYELYKQVLQKEHSVTVKYYKAVQKMKQTDEALYTQAEKMLKDAGNLPTDWKLKYQSLKAQMEGLQQMPSGAEEFEKLYLSVKGQNALKAYPEMELEVLGKPSLKEKAEALQKLIERYEASENKWLGKLQEISESLGNEKINAMKAAYADKWLEMQSLPTAKEKYSALKEMVDKFSIDNTVTFGGAKKYNLLVPEEKAQFEKIKNFYMQKYKAAMVSGQTPSPAMKAAYNLLSPAEKELWDTKIEIAKGKITGKAAAPKIVPPPPPTMMGESGTIVMKGTTSKEIWKNLEKNPHVDKIIHDSPDILTKINESIYVDKIKIIQEEMGKLGYQFVEEGVAPVASVKKDVPIGMLNFDDMVKYGEQRGSNLGGYYHMKDNPAERYYVKIPDNVEVAKNEMLASKLYQAAGVEVPELTYVQVGDKLGIASRIIDGLDSLDMAAVKAGKIAGIGDNFVVDAWLGDWDVVGLSYDNLLQKGGRAVRIDVGGSLRFRAQGGLKGKAFGKTVTELDSMRDPKVNAQAAKVFANVKKGDLEYGVKKVLSISDDEIKSLVAKYGPTNKSEADELAEILIARKQDIARRFPEVKIEEVTKNVPPPKVNIVSPFEQEQIINSRLTGYGLRFDKEEIEDHNVLFFVDKKQVAQGEKDRTYAVLKVREEGAQKLKSLVSQAGEEQTFSTQAVHDDMQTAIRGIFKQLREGNNIREVDIERSQTALRTYNKTYTSLKKLANEGKILQEQLNAFADHYKFWCDLLDKATHSLNQKIPVPSHISMASGGGALKRFDDIPLIISREKSSISFTLKSVKFDAREISRGYGTAKANQYVQGDAASKVSKCYEANVNGVRVRYWGTDNVPFAFKNRLDIMIEEMGEEATTKIVETLKKLGIDTSRPSAADEELLYLKQMLRHIDFKASETCIARVSNLSVEEQILALRKDASRMVGVPDISKLRDYNPAGYRGAFDTGSAKLYRPDLVGNPEFEKFRKEYDVIHRNTNADFVNVIDKILSSGGNLVSTTNKMRIGIPASGMSPGPDMDTGGADYFFTRIYQKGKSTSGGQTFVWDADILRRLDCITYDHDAYGECTASYQRNNKKKGFVEGWKEAAHRDRNETNFKHELSIFDRLKYIICSDERERNGVIKVFQKHKYNTFPDGRQLTEVIRVKNINIV